MGSPRCWRCTATATPARRPPGCWSRNKKSLTKKILAYHGIRVPAFAEFHPGEKPLRPSELRFPLIVKPLLEDASIGIAQASVVEDDQSLAERVKFIHEKFNQAAIVEELIEGQELYVGLLGNDKLQVLPIVEMTFGEAEAAEQRIATDKASLSYDDFIQRIVDEAMKRG